MKAFQILLIALSLATASVAFTGCNKQQSSPEAAAEAVEEAGDAAEEAADEAADAIEDLEEQ